MNYISEFILYTIKTMSFITKSKSKSTYEQFQTDLQNNIQYENKAAERVKSIFPYVSIQTNDDYKYDFIIQPENLSFEVKTDHLALRTNNFFIEFFCRGRPSGISKSEADYYIFHDLKLFYMIPTTKLKELIINCPIRETSDGLTCGYLLNRFTLIQNSTII
jgi:hypothetical protein